MRLFVLWLILFVLFFSSSVSAQDTAAASPKQGWGNFEVVTKEEPSWITHTLLWLPNRVLDLVDVFRVDAGIGVGTGAVVRITRQGQFGLRVQDPGMLRVGLLGRDWPVGIEDKNEEGAFSHFQESPTRNLCDGVVGAGLDFFLLGIHVGVCPEEAVDFLLGIFLIDIMEDDYE